MAHDPQARREATAMPVVVFGAYGRSVEGYRPDPAALAVAMPASSDGCRRHVAGPHLRVARATQARNRTGIVGISRGEDRTRGHSYYYVQLGARTRKFCITTLGESEALRRAIALRREHLIKLALANAEILAARARATGQATEEPAR